MNIRNLFGYGQVKLRKDTTAVYRYSNDSFIGLHPVSLYFTTYPLKTKKGQSFTKWLQIYNMLLNKEHLTQDGLDMIRALSKQMNAWNCESSRTGSSKT